jgi:hypothetical protein
MKMRYATVIASVLGLALTIAIVGMVGCDTPSTSEPESYFDNNPYSSLPRETPTGPALSISPANIVTTNTSDQGQAFLFSALGGTDPIAWEVVNEDAGTLDVQPNGRDAVYTVVALKSNTLIARDAAGGAAIASIRGQDTPSLPSLSIAATSDAKLVFDGELMLLYAHGGMAPFDWHLVYPGRGEITRYGPGRLFIEYMRTDAQDQVVILTDASGAMAELRIAQPVEGTPGGGGTTNAPTTYAPLVASADPSTVDVNNDLSLLSVTGGKPPYTWALVPGMTTGGILLPNVGDHVIYQRNSAGDCAVIVTDDRGTTAYVIISQPPP